MDRDDDLLLAIAADPGDDAPRLVYADWLEERGDPRAEFIRAQCELAGLPDGDPRRPDLEATSIRLLRRFGKGWAAPVRRWARGWTFRRGFVEGVKLLADDFLDFAEEILAAAPIREVRLLGAAPRIDALAACPHLARIDSLDLRGAFLRDPGEPEPEDDMRQYPAMEGYWDRREASRSEAQAAGARHLRRLLASPHLDGLRTLTLEDNRLGAAGVRALIESDVLDRLEALDLRRNDLSVESLGALVESGRLRRLRSLRLGFLANRDPDFDSNDRGNASPPAGYVDYDPEGLFEYSPGGGRYMARGPMVRQLAPLFGRLSELELGACELTHVALQDFRGGPSGLRRLSLHHNFLGLPGARALAASPVTAGLVALDLGSSYMDDRAAAVLAGCPGLAGLAELDLGNHELGPGGVAALAAGTFAGNLQRLGLAGSRRQEWYGNRGRSWQIKNEGVRALAEGADRLPRLAWLDLRTNGLTSAAVKVLAASPLLECLAWLDLRGNQLGDAGAAALATVGPWPRLAWLDLRNNGIGLPARRLLRKAFGPLVRFGEGPPRRGQREEFDDEEDVTV